MTTMTYDGYVATVELDEEAGLFHGEVINTRDVLTFQGRTLDELKAAFADTGGPIREISRFGYRLSFTGASPRPPRVRARASMPSSHRPWNA